MRGRITHDVIATLILFRDELADRCRDPFPLVCTTLLLEALPAGLVSALEADAVAATATGHVESYLRHFMPPAEWHLLDAEMTIAEGRIDIAWRTPHGVVWDEIKAGGRRARGGPGPQLRQAQRYASAGRLLHPDFLGVRLLYLGAWRRSLFITPGGAEISLTETPYWFDSAEPCNREPGR
jgi:hypothetical protein